MSKTMVMGSLLGLWLATAVSGCEIENCERGAHCGDGEEHDGVDDDEREQCENYCVRVSICGGPGADDLDECIEACEVRFDILPKQTAELCACAEWSSCEDVNNGRCSDPGTGGSGGSSTGGSSTGGSSNQGGSTASGGTAQGGAPAQGGAASTGGSPAGGSSSTGGSATCQGGSSSGGESGGAAGEGSGACTCDCDCSSGERCVEGLCTA
jgi:hypothetical protein